MRARCGAGALDGWSALAAPAPGRAPPADHPADQGGGTGWAGLAGASVDAELVLEVAARATCLAEVIDGGAARGDGGAQDGADDRDQGHEGGAWDAAGGSLRTQCGAEQGLLGIDVADPHHRRLVHDHRLDRLAAPTAGSGQVVGGECGFIQRLDAQSRQPGMLLLRAQGDEVEQAEPSRIPEGQASTILQMEIAVVMVPFAASRGEPPGAGHAQVAEQGPGGSVEQEVFGAAPDCDHGLTRQARRQPGGDGGTQGAPAQLDACDGRSGEEQLQAGAYGLDFGQLGHGLTLAAAERPPNPEGAQGKHWRHARGSFTIAAMSAYLEGLSAAIAGRRLAISDDKPLVIKIATSSRARGRVLIGLDAGRYHLTNESAVQCSINGETSRAGDLDEGDEVQIGKDRFRMVIVREDEHDRIGTQKLAPSASSSAAEAEICAVCDARIGGASGGWSDGSRSICERCLATGVKPEHLPSSPSPTPTLHQDVTPAAPAAVIAPPSAESGAITPVAIRAQERAPQRLSASDTTPVSVRAVPAPPSGEPARGAARRGQAAAPAASASSSGQVPTIPDDAPTSESDRMRHSRRISASRLTAVEPAGNGREGLLSKVGRVFGRRDERYQRLEELQVERLARLAEAGRLALSAGLGLGLGEALVASLLQGKRVTLGAADCSTTGLEQWRALRKRMDLVVAEIAALRRILGMGPDPETLLQQTPTLRVDERRQQERAFAALDGLSTDELGIELSEGAVAPAPAAPPAHGSGRHRQPRRRR